MYNEQTSRYNKTKLTTSINKVVTILRDAPTILLASFEVGDVHESKRLKDDIKQNRRGNYTSNYPCA